MRVSTQNNVSVRHGPEAKRCGHLIKERSTPRHMSHCTVRVYDCFANKMAAVRGFGTVLLLCVVVAEVAMLATEVYDGTATRTRGQGRAPNGRRRQQVLKEQNRAVSFVQTARRRRPGVGLKPELNETLGPTTVERDGRFLATCGQNTKENCTYFVNQGYPGPYDGTGSCQLTINKAHPDICQFR
ncbi:uncharacterized protein LOC110834661 [Zootermopsis nevadensis]|uniref:uncharacterized protein LOC110834661 n=1 Tax=Zootermopsis nevadensis TaxID=136037 RepID=UPI000B8E94C8|nr:uncharacterized protein LOC110834661 [Zootermopsis nevadensis]